MDKFLQQYHVRHYAKGEIVLVQGESPPCAYVIKQGVVKTYNLTSAGEEKPIMYDMAGEIFPIGWVFAKLRYAQYFYEAFTDMEVYCIPREDLVSYFLKHPEELFKTHNLLVSRYLNQQMRINALEQSKAAAKVVNTIHFLCLRFGVDVKPNVVKIELPLTQQELANFMGLTRETTGIELKKLQRQGILTYKHQNYIVKTDKLEELLDEEYDHGRQVDDKLTLE